MLVHNIVLGYIILFWVWINIKMWLFKCVVRVETLIGCYWIFFWDLNVLLGNVSVLILLKIIIIQCRLLLKYIFCSLFWLVLHYNIWYLFNNHNLWSRWNLRWLEHRTASKNKFGDPNVKPAELLYQKTLKYLMLSKSKMLPMCYTI